MFIDTPSSHDFKIFIDFCSYVPLTLNRFITNLIENIMIQTEKQPTKFVNQLQMTK